MSNRKHAASVSHSEATIAELRADRGFAVEYLKSALEELDNPERRAVGLLALRDVAGLLTKGAPAPHAPRRVGVQARQGEKGHQNQRPVLHVNLPFP